MIILTDAQLDMAGRALTPREALILLAGPDRRLPEGARDHALLLAMLRLGLRVSEACSLRASSIRWSHGRWTLRVKVKGGRERTCTGIRDAEQLCRISWISRTFDDGFSAKWLQ